MNFSDLVITCPVCGKTVQLETCKVDERGQALHPDCAVAHLVSTAQANKPTVRPETRSSMA
jgi:hypothetical protein